MGFTVPNETSGGHATASFTAQAGLDSTDFAILAAAPGGTGVLRGCDVTAQGTPNMTLAVAAGSVAVDGAIAVVAAGDVTITTAHATHPRIDLVVVNASGTKSVEAGTAAANPVAPAIPASRVVLAAVWVPANDTAIGSTQIVDKRVILMGGGLMLDYVERSTDFSATAANFTDVTGMTITIPPTLGDVFIKWFAPVANNTVDKRTGIYVVETSATSSGNGINIVTIPLANGYENASGEFKIAPNSASRTYKMQVYNQTNPNTATVSAANGFALGIPFWLAAFLGNPS